VKASYKKVRSSLRSTKRRMTSFIKRTGLNKQAQKQRAAQRAAATEGSSQRLVQSNLFDAPTTETEDDVAPPDVFELFSNEELALQQATESAESVEWGATPDGRQPIQVDFFPVETASTLPVETYPTVPVETASMASVDAASVDPVKLETLTPDVGDEHLVNRAWFLQPSAGTWLLPVPFSLQDVSSTPLLDNAAEQVSSSDAIASVEVLPSKISAPTCSSLAQIRSCGGA